MPPTAETPLASVHDVAVRLIELQRAQTESGNGLAAMASSKLHKLTYFCQAYHLAWFGEPLFSEDVVAAASGPVIAEFFPHHADEPFPESWPEGSSTNLSDRQCGVVDTIFGHDSYTSGRDLGRLAQGHAPWIRARAKSAGDGDRPVIDRSDMAAFYRALGDAPATRQEYAARFMDRYRHGRTLDAADPSPA